MQIIKDAGLEKAQKKQRTRATLMRGLWAFLMLIGFLMSIFAHIEYSFELFIASIVGGMALMFK